MFQGQETQETYILILAKIQVASPRQSLILTKEITISLLKFVEKVRSRKDVTYRNACFFIILRANAINNKQLNTYLVEGSNRFSIYCY